MTLLSLLLKSEVPIFAFESYDKLWIEIADKTAEYVAKNGSAFEEIVAKSEANNPKFSFMKPNDPYRAYFEQKVIEFAKGISMSFISFWILRYKKEENFSYKLAYFLTFEGQKF